MTSDTVVLLILGVLLLPLLALARWARVFPGPRAAALLLLPAVLSLAVLVSPAVTTPILVLDGLIALLFLADLLTLPRRKAFQVERETGRVASLRRAHPVSITVTHSGRRTRRFRLRDGLPPELHAEPPEHEVVVTGRARATLRYVFRAARRGAYSIATVHLRSISRLRLWQKLLVYDVASTIHVYPDLQQLSQYALLARTNRLSLVGVRRVRRVGQDNDFERLRDFTLDDNYKRIDWRATARRQKLTVKDYQTSQSQRIIFLLDCGRMMTNEASGLSLLDHAFNAMLMLSYVALRQNDHVGLICFSDEINGFVPVRGGMRQMNRLLHASFDRFPSLVESRYDLAFRYLATHCRKRSLVVLVTNVIDEVNSHQIHRYLSNLAGRHLPLGVLLRDHRLFTPVEAEPVGETSLYQAAAAAEILIWRHQVLADLRSKGVLVLDVFPESMTAPLINRYLQVKARHLL